jgi:hypothetical protein
VNLNQKISKSQLKAFAIAGLVLLGACSKLIDSLKPKPEPTASAPSLIPIKPASTGKVEDFKTALPPEDKALRDHLMADGFVSGYFSNVWIGYADRQDLIRRGFFLNPLYRHNGEGEGDKAKAKGACSPIGFNGAFMCGKGTMAAYQWGIQNDKAIAAINKMEETWGGQTPATATAPPIEQPAVERTEVRSMGTGMLTGADRTAAIAILGDDFAPLHVGFPGDEVTTIAATQRNGETWYKIKFTQSGAEGWIGQGNLMLDQMRGNSATQIDSTPTSETTRSSTGRCDRPDDVDSRGRRCGARAKSVR